MSPQTLGTLSYDQVQEKTNRVRHYPVRLPVSLQRIRRGIPQSDCHGPVQGRFTDVGATAADGAGGSVGGGNTLTIAQAALIWAVAVRLP